MIFLRAVLTATSPLMVGSGENENTDKDVMTDANGKPYIPATALAGVCRHYFNNDGEIFGFQSDNKDDNGETIKGQQSKIIFYDATLIGDI